MHDFSQAETGWFSPFVTVSLCPGAVSSAAKSKAPLWCGEHCPAVSTPVIPLPAGSQAVRMPGWGLLCGLQGESHPGGLHLLGCCRGCGWFGRCWWAGMLCPRLAEAGGTTSGKPHCCKTLCSSSQRWGAGLQKPPGVGSSDGWGAWSWGEPDELLAMQALTFVS